MRSVLLLILFACLSSPVFAQGAGTIRGKVTDEDNFSLAGANVYIKGLRKGAATNKDGEFTLLDVPAGAQTLTFSYLGYRTETRQVTVTAGSVARISVVMQSGVIRGEEVVILGERLKGQAKSLNQQRSNPNITNVVSADQIGRFPDANIGDALKRIPAITVNYDQGEARFVNVRGTEPRLNSVMINGERIPSAEGEIRAVQVDLIPSDAIASIEVSKAVTPDMEADAIGGAVNLVTRGAPNALRLSGTLGSGYNMLSEEPMWIGSAVLGTRLLDEKVGIVLGASYHNHFLGSHNSEGTWAIDDNGNIFAEEWDVRTYDLQRLRRSVTGTVDFRLNPSHTLYLRGIYNHRNDWENRYRLRYKLEETTDGISPETEIRRQTKGGIGDNDYARLEDQRTYSMGLAGDHLFGGLLSVDWSATIAKASEERPNERYISWRVKDVPVAVDLSNLETPYFNATDPASVALGAYSLKEITEEYQYTEEIDYNASIDFALPLTREGAYKNTLKFGGRFKQKDKNRDNNFFEYEPLSGFESLTDNIDVADYSVDDFLAGDYRAGDFTTPEFLGNLDLDNESLFEKKDLPEEYAAANYEATEKVMAGYAMIDQSFGDKLSMIAGVRIEHTAVDYLGNEFNDDTEEINPTEGDDSYTNVLPGVHFRYALTRNSILRLAWTNTLARPNYYDLVPYRAIAVEDEELAIGNPALEPTLSMNFDLMAEQYFESVGILSGGVFYKDITDFIYIYGERNYVDPVSGNTYDFTQPRNGAKATLFGLEFALQRQLDFLPGLLSNFGIYTNYTFTSSTTDNPDFDGRDIELPGAAPHTLNAALTWQDTRLVVGISFNYSSPYLDPDDVDLTPGLERYYDEVTYLDVNASYAITPQLRIFAEANNLLNQPLRYYAGESIRTYQAEYYNRRFTAGIKFDL